MNFKDLALHRESCRNYDEKPVPQELLQAILDTACLSPSACNSQPWRLLAVQGETAKQLRPLLQQRNLNRFTEQVSTFVVICETEAVLGAGVRDNSQHFAQMDIGMVTMILTLAATDLGLSTCILGCFDEAGVKDLLGVPEEIPVRLVVAVGYANEEGVRQKVRKPSKETQNFGRWGS